MDCLDNEDASVLLLLSPCMYCKGRGGVLGVLAGPSLSPVNNSLLNASTSRCGLFLLATELVGECVIIYSSFISFDAACSVSEDVCANGFGGISNVSSALDTGG